MLIEQDLTSLNFEQVYDLYYHDVCKFLNYYTHDKSAIEDVVQDVFVKLWENKSYLQMDYVRTYLLHSARNRMLNYLRDTNRRTTLLNLWHNNSSSHEHYTDCFDLEEFSEILAKSVDALPPKCQQVFRLCKLEEQAYKDVAEQLGLSKKTIEAQMGIALKHIRRDISAYYNDPKVLSTLLFLLTHGL